MNWIQKIASDSDLGRVEVSEGDRVFRTGQPVSFPYKRMREPAPPPRPGDPYGQNTEPHGRYMITNQYPADTEEDSQWEHGDITFQNPLVIRLTSDPDTIYGEKGWKAALSRAYGGKTGIELSRAIVADGHDGVVTVWVQDGEPSETREIVDLSGLR